MLIEFSVENHRAFREKQTFSLAASTTTERSGHGHVLQTGLSVVPQVLSEACIFGANGSGKSSLISAMSVMKRIVRESGKNSPEDEIPTKPFIFHSDWREKPTEFEVVFVLDGTLYQYGFVVSRERVLEEWLFSRPKTTGRERQLFSRIYDEENDEYEWELNAVQLRGPRESWRTQTLPNALFLSTAVRLNAEVLAKPFKWITSDWRLLVPNSNGFRNGSTVEWLKDDGEKKRILEFLRKADISLYDLHLEEQEPDSEVRDLAIAMYKALDGKKDASEFPTIKIPSVSTFRMDNSDKPTSLPMDEESTGTKALFSLAGPILKALDSGSTLVVDELNTGLHPLAFQYLVGLFADPEVNDKGAQLVFTTHDTSISEQECLGRDQIWIVEKARDLAAALVPLTDFKERGAKGFQKKYLDGRFGGVPRVER
ncbi:AAA family ATPase [Ruegeria halocynthiae]|uniref:AAA family ATPase n=1 Tax=Ruegeria halocynthiae TaxID=985054 RepID=UPI000566F25B|nr:ATP-binding protein [Ruegeria halocynthiae]